MPNLMYEQGWIQLLRGTLDLESDDIRVALVDNSYIPNATTDEFFDDITGEIAGGGYASGGELLTNKSIEIEVGARLGFFTADDITVWNSAIFTGARAAVVYKDTGVEATSTLIAYVDFGADRSAPFNLNWSSQGVFLVNSEFIDPDQEADLETGDLSQFDLVVGGTKASENAALAGLWGYAVLTTGGAPDYGQFTDPTNQPSLTLENLFDPNSLTMAAADRFQLMLARGSGAVASTIRTDLQFVGGDYRLIMSIFNDASGSSSTTPKVISDVSQRVRMLWAASSGVGQDDGFALLYVDGVLDSILEGIDNDTYDVDTTRQGAVAALDAGTSGSFFMDNLLWDAQVVFPNPLAVDFDMPTTVAAGLDATIVVAITFAVVQEAIVELFPVGLPDQKLLVITPGLAEYKVRLKDQSGVVVAEFDTWVSLSFVHVVNQRGSIRFEINGDDDRNVLFVTDSQIEVWRRNQIVGLDWYLEWEGFIRTPNTLLTQNGTRRFIVYGFSYLDLARRAEISWPPGTDQAVKDAAAETVMKELASENIGVEALEADGRIADNVMPGLTIEANTGIGETWSAAMDDENLLDALEDIALFTAENDPVDFDIIGIGAATFQFRTYAGQRGIDSRRTNTDGNDPVIFGVNLGNMIRPVLSENRSTVFSVIYAIGAGSDDSRIIALAQSNTEVAISPWNRVEKSVPGGSASQGCNIQAQLAALALAELEENKFDARLSFDVIQLRSSYYGLHYTWGDRITAEFEGQDFDKKIIEVRITVSANANGESITIEFGNN